MENNDRVALVIPNTDGFCVSILKSHSLEKYPLIRDILIEMANALGKIIPYEINGDKITVELKSLDNSIGGYDFNNEGPSVFVIESTFKIDYKMAYRNQTSLVCYSGKIPEKNYFIQTYCYTVYHEVLMALIHTAKTGKLDEHAYRHLILREGEHK